MSPGRNVANGLAGRVRCGDNRRRPVREYTRTQTLVANLPYEAMVVMGTILVARAFDFSACALVGAGGYLAYGITGALWIMVLSAPTAAITTLGAVPAAMESCPRGSCEKESRSALRRSSSVTFP